MSNAVAEFENSTVRVIVGDALRLLRTFPSNSVDAVVCDPPYAIRASKDPATAHRTASPPRGCGSCGVEALAAGFDICVECLRTVRVDGFADAAMLGQQSANWHEKATHSRGYADNDNWLFGLWVLLWASECLRVLRPGGHLVAFGGTRTWHRLACGVEDAGFEMRDSLAWLYATGVPKSLNVSRAVDQLLGGDSGPRVMGVPTQAVRDRPIPHPASRAGLYTGVKPAHEPIVLARKPVEGTVAQNLVAYGTGALDVAATRSADGRWPSNVMLDDYQADLLDDALATRGSRFFFVAKPNSRERVTVDGLSHPTVKPLALMRELVRLATPPAGVVLDPFAGSGPTVEACVQEGRDCLAIEQAPDYLRLIEARLDRCRVDELRRVGSAVATREPRPATAGSMGTGGSQDTLF